MAPDLGRGELLDDPRQHVERRREEELDLLRRAENRVDGEHVPQEQHGEPDADLHGEEFWAAHGDIPPPGGEGRLGRSPSGVGGAGRKARAAKTGAPYRLRASMIGFALDPAPPTPAPPHKGE